MGKTRRRKEGGAENQSGQVILGLDGGLKKGVVGLI
jgi:hypothetical protein